MDFYPGDSRNHIGHEDLYPNCDTPGTHEHREGALSVVYDGTCALGPTWETS